MNTLVKWQKNVYCKQSNTGYVQHTINIGCGVGGMVYKALDQGYDAYGIDGDFRLERDKPDNFILQDFTKGPAKCSKKSFDLRLEL